MPITSLQHYNVLTLDLAETIRFYCDHLGLRAGPAPGRAPEEGAWIYDKNDIPVVHVQAVDPTNPSVRLDEVKSRLGDLTAIHDVSDLRGSAAIEHVAFNCEDYMTMSNRLKAAGLQLRESVIASIPLRQIFVNDPNGITIELNFFGAK
jgi:catechol 2,3-dioxygenase-like lactoylglutathione lyase family enzyme